MSDRFDFEQQILKCWNVTDDIKEVSEAITECDLLNIDETTNALNGLAAMYELKFNKLWDLFESVHMNLVRDEKFAREDADAMRQQIQELQSDRNDYGKYYTTGAGGSVPLNQGAGFTPTPATPYSPPPNFTPIPIIKGTKK